MVGWSQLENPSTMMSRRDMMASGLILPASSALGLNQRLVQQATAPTPGPQGKRRLTVHQLPAEEVAERERLYQEQVAAQARFGAYVDELRKKYGGEPGVNIEFEEDYVFVRDYRDEMLAKQAVWRENHAIPEPPHN
jgi:hypothetical protein